MAGSLLRTCARLTRLAARLGDGLDAMADPGTRTSWVDAGSAFDAGKRSNDSEVLVTRSQSDCAVPDGCCRRCGPNARMAAAAQCVR